MPNCTAFIPAKGHSNRLPGKNMRMCAGKTLVQRAVECALASRVFRWTVVSSEDQSILNTVTTNLDVRKHLRPGIYSEDGVTVASVVAGWLGAQLFVPDSFCVLWPTSPLRTPEILREMWEKFQASGESSLHSAVHTDFGRMLQHEGTAIFMKTLCFLQRMSLDLKLGDPVYIVPEELDCDVNTAEDLAEAERRLLEREAPKLGVYGFNSPAYWGF